MERKHLIVITAVVVLLVGATYGYLEFNRGVAGTASMPVQEKVTAGELLADFQTDEAAANQRYVGMTEQVVQVSGTIRAMEPLGTGVTNVVLETGDDLAGIVCEFQDEEVPTDWRSGTDVSIKGICTGLLLDVVLVRCVAVENK